MLNIENSACSKFTEEVEERMTKHHGRKTKRYKIEKIFPNSEKFFLGRQKMDMSIDSYGGDICDNMCPENRFEPRKKMQVY